MAMWKIIDYEFAIDSIFKSNTAICSPDIILLHILKTGLSINHIYDLVYRAAAVRRIWAGEWAVETSM